MQLTRPVQGRGGGWVDSEGFDGLMKAIVCLFCPVFYYLPAWFMVLVKCIGVGSCMSLS